MKSPSVLIVGAGPAGLTLALELARGNIPLRIVDAGLQRADSESRAIGLHPRSMEAFARNGAIKPFLEAGNTLAAANFYSSGTRILQIGLIGSADQPFPFSLLIQQGKSERFLIERLRDLGIEVERSITLAAIGQTLTATTAVLRHEDGRLEEAAFAYIAGCDGAHSIVRQSLGIGFGGKPLEGRFATGDVAIDFEDQEWADHEIHTLLRPGRFAILGRLRDGAYRVVVDVTDLPDVTAANVTVADLQNGFSPFSEFKGRISDPQWISVFRVSSRVADAMRGGRIFLVGDAAHIHSPESGQGMNAGVQDAINLAWKLAAVLRGAASDDLLLSYENERLPIVRSIVEETALAQTAISLEGAAWIEMRDVAASALSHFGPMQRALTAAFSATAYHYRSSEIVGQFDQSAGDYLKAVINSGPRPSIVEHRHYRDGPEPGDWAPDADRLIMADGRETTLHELMANDLRSLVIVFSGANSSAGDLERLRNLAAALSEDFGQLLDLHLFTHKPSSGAIHDFLGLAHARYGASYECLVLVRPDGYIGYRSQPAADAPLRAFLAKTWGVGFTTAPTVSIEHGQAS